MAEYDVLRRMAMMLLSENEQIITKDRVLDAVQRVAKVSPGFAEQDRLVRDIESTFSITVAEGTMLTEDRDHIPWLDSKRGVLEWEFWRRYRAWLNDSKGWSPAIVNKMDGLTDQVLDRIEEPNRPGSWDRRGLVVGQVQSGKTAHYTGLICKAVDAGYKLVVVLAGVHNSLEEPDPIEARRGVPRSGHAAREGLEEEHEQVWGGLAVHKGLARCLPHELS